ncbi:hypothetical protein FUAX_02070 [Fulvitalea axinellae]|uniref:Lipoprotein n=1 Tax=Fulvitalea axinellae TaxID=1182444 RepID=A0AAU9CEK9_9BACT|nr:hypothetical protein FUAX_02070 [Fulvitalea axinellae]
MVRRFLSILAILSIGCKQTSSTSTSEASTLDRKSGRRLVEIRELPSSEEVPAVAVGKRHRYVNPYHYGELSKYYDPKQVDFSSEYYKIQNSLFTDLETDVFDSVASYDFSGIWKRGYSQEGVIGVNYRRIEISISDVVKDKANPMKYFVYGVSEVADNRCDFSGELELLNGYSLRESDVENVMQGVVFGRYTFREDSAQNHPGLFSGIVESGFLIDHQDGKVKLDTLSIDADGYANNNFVGTWTGYDAGKAKKCIWGEYRLPFTFDFDIGDGEMIVNKKYRKYGWGYYDEVYSE